jgi:hypothetical protein
LYFFYHHTVKDRTVMKCILFGNAITFNICYKYIENKITINQYLYNHIKLLQPDIIIYPSSAYSPEDNDLISIGKEMCIKTLFIIDNWDNLSSKTIFASHPDYIAVWGEQTKKHAIEIQGFKSDQVFILGSARFNDYLLPEVNSTINSLLPEHYVLFAGCAVPYDEISVLHIMEEEISNNAEMYNGLKIIYRPHPWRQARYNEFREEFNFKHVIVDPQLSKYFKNNKSNIGFQPDLKYYPLLLSNMLFTVMTPTTMIVEALIFNKKILLLGNDDNLHITTAKNMLKVYPHLEDVEKVEGVTLCSEISILSCIFRDMFLNNRPLNVVKQNAERSYYLFSDEVRYRDRIAKLIKEIV